MATYKNPAHEKNLVGAFQAGQLVYRRFEYDLAASYHTNDLNLNDLVQVGVVPAGHRLVEPLSRLNLPAIESGTPASDYMIGTAEDPDALKGSAASESAVVLFGEDWTASNVVGSKTEDTPIYIKIITASMDTTVASGTIQFDAVYRPWDDAVDG